MGYKGNFDSKTLDTRFSSQCRTHFFLPGILGGSVLAVWLKYGVEDRSGNPGVTGLTQYCQVYTILLGLIKYVLLGRPVKYVRFFNKQLFVLTR